MDTATWMTNIGNEFGQVLNCVLTTGEEAGLDDLCQGIVKCYRDADEPEPDVMLTGMAAVRQVCDLQSFPTRNFYFFFHPKMNEIAKDILKICGDIC